MPIIIFMAPAQVRFHPAQRFEPAEVGARGSALLTGPSPTPRRRERATSSANASERWSAHEVVADRCGDRILDVAANLGPRAVGSADRRSALR